MPFVVAQIVEKPAREGRRGERRGVRALAQCRRGSTRESVSLCDLSPGGARIQTMAPLRAGHSLWLKLPGLEPIEARVVWTRSCESGCEFVRPLHPAVFDSLWQRV